MASSLEEEVERIAIIIRLGSLSQVSANLCLCSEYRGRRMQYTVVDVGSK